jgi:hypothetical protein
MRWRIGRRRLRGGVMFEFGEEIAANVEGRG